MDLSKELMKHIEAARQEYIKAYNAIDQETSRHNLVVKNLGIVRNELTPEAYTRKITSENADYQQAIKDIKKKLDEAIANIKQAYLKEVYKYYQPSGSALDKDDVNLINSGIVLTSAEVERLAAKNANNTTMLRLIEQYKTARKISVSQDVEIAFSRANMAGQTEEAAFTSFEHLAGQCITMALTGQAGTNAYIQCADKLENYVADTELKLKKATVFLDEFVKNEILKMEDEKKQNENKAVLGN